MKISKLLAMILCIVMVMSFAACSNNTATTSTPESEASLPLFSDNGEESDDADNDSKDSPRSYNIGIIQQTQHVALDAATQGFRDALTEKLGDENVSFDYQNAQDDSNTCATIANGFAASNVDLIMANATTALQASSSASATIPILGTSITDYSLALDLKDFDGTIGGNVSGTSDLAPLDEQAEILNTLFPDAENIGLIYCSAEPNSKYQVDIVMEALDKMGYSCTLYPFSDSNDLSAVTTTAAESSDVIYVPTDNTAASNASIIDNICQPAGVPIVAGEQGVAAKCGVATLSIDYYDLGYKTGEMAYEILAEGADISEMPVQYAPKFTKMYNPVICENLGIEIPEDYVAIEE